MKSLYCTLLALFIAGILNAQITIKLEEVSEHVGDSVTVCGKVADMRYFETSRNKPTFLNMGARYPSQQLTVVIWENVRGQFTGKVEDLKDKEICITGRIILYKEKPEIVINSPSQISMQ
jgi:hypothetical protein